ncbi:MAG: hypothetical protein IPM64_00985 [Phycisphaerales bacterium]|nr:hypothetical protein [Phycisphaerales bacterium]
MTADPRSTRPLRATLFVAAVALSLHLCGCRGSEPAEPPQVLIEQALPEDAARSLVRVLREEKRMRIDGRVTEADALQDVIAKRLAAVNRVEALVRAVFDQTGRKADAEAIRKGADRAIRGWGALLGYYLDDMPIEAATRLTPEVDGFVQIRIPAGPRLRTGVRFICERGKDQMWRIITVDFEAPTPQPVNPPSATNPATNPAANPPSAPTPATNPASAAPAAPSPAHLTPPPTPATTPATQPAGAD